MFTAAQTASLVFAAGKGSRMKSFDGNKTLLPLVPAPSAFQGSQPILLHILGSLPPGPKALVIHHRREEVMDCTRDLDLRYYVQPELNGTGGALLSAADFIEKERHDQLIITMGDVPFVRKETYLDLVRVLQGVHLVVLGFVPQDRRQYGVLEVEGERVKKITEWKYWSTYPAETQKTLRICNSGIYAARTQSLIPYLKVLRNNPHRVMKEREGRMTEIQEFFITDLVEWMDRDGLKVGFALAGNENEVMGIDDLSSLQRAQQYFKASSPNPGRD
jgi:bifunctional UDP-N-acetylglucosamine pyrophosphorylase/glucosamine-1-phosphate N-acetyltransferase